MAVTEQVSRPAPFVEKLGTNLAENVLAQQGVPIVSSGIAGLTQFAGEDPAAFAARQKAGQAFDIRKQNLAGLAPQVAGQDALQQQAQSLATQGVGSFEPFLQTAGQQAQVAAGLGTQALGQLQTAGSTFGAIPTGPMTTAQTQQYMSPYQSQVIDASLAEFDRNKQIQEQQIKDQQTALGALGSGRAGVQLAEFGTGAARERALLQAGLLQQGFGQAAAARQQDIQNRFGLGQAQSGLAGQQLGLGQFQSGLAGQVPQLQRADISTLGQVGAAQQAQSQAELDAARQGARTAAYEPLERLGFFGQGVTGLMGGYPAQYQFSSTPPASPLQTALGLGTGLAGIFGALK